MSTILRKDIWSYWTVLMAWLKLITWCHWQFHLALQNRITWRYWTVSPDVIGQFHPALLNRIIWCYWTVSLGVTGPYHLTLLDGFTCHYWIYWTVSPCWNLSPDITGQQSNCSMCNDQLFICDWSQSTWHISQWHRQISLSILSK